MFRFPPKVPRAKNLFTAALVHVYPTGSAAALRFWVLDRSGQRQGLCGCYLADKLDKLARGSSSMAEQPPRVPADRRDRVLALRQMGVTPREIGARLGLTKNQVYYCLYPAGRRYRLNIISKPKRDEPVMPIKHEPAGPRADDHPNMVGVRFEDIQLKPTQSKPVSGARWIQGSSGGSGYGCAAAMCVDAG